jgi:hypothetical protein
MTEHQTFIYEAFVGKLENGQQVLIQIFRNPATLDVLASQIAFKTIAGDTWQTPYPLEKL